jgi:hypothetical protein
VKPLLHAGHKEMWQLRMLESQAPHGAAPGASR